MPIFRIRDLKSVMVALFNKDEDISDLSDILTSLLTLINYQKLLSLLMEMTS